MKNALAAIVLSLLQVPVFAQAQNKGDKFLGTWEPCSAARYKTASSCVIRRRGGEYTLQYLKTINNTPQIRAFFYKLKDDSLAGEDKRYGSIVFVRETGHIKWREGEWQRDTTYAIKGAPLNKK